MNYETYLIFSNLMCFNENKIFNIVAERYYFQTYPDQDIYFCTKFLSEWVIITNDIVRQKVRTFIQIYTECPAKFLTNGTFFLSAMSQRIWFYFWYNHKIAEQNKCPHFSQSLYQNNRYCFGFAVIKQNVCRFSIYLIVIMG